MTVQSLQQQFSNEGAVRDPAVDEERARIKTILAGRFGANLDRARMLAFDSDISAAECCGILNLSH